ncbi:MAG: hypothetical protein B6D44_13575 [Ignavibacteriales bacterium UTCHB2]|jgi:DNA repair photolyase|nr:MAG: hypothetical protein B6D44_13575 [Ignavibacteriales bacterium UTCHB2]
MIISASRRTDIPAYYSEWFYNRVKEGYCTVPNPFNADQVYLVDLRPKSVTAIVFWTRNAYPLLKNINLLDEKGYKYYFQFTVNNYPKIYEPYNPSFDLSTKCFEEIANKLGIGKIVWRYDPILFTKDLTIEFHKHNFSKIFDEIGDYTKRIVISIVDNYKKTANRLRKLETEYEEEQIEKVEIEEFLKFIVEKASTKGIEVESCAEAKEFGHLGIAHGKCIDDRLLKQEFGIDITYKKDKNQRLPCGCMVSKDVGMNNTCLMGCEYCYATTSHHAAVKNKKKHDPNFSSLIVHKMSEEIEEKIKAFKQQKNFKEKQMALF